MGLGLGHSSENKLPTELRPCHLHYDNINKAIFISARLWKGVAVGDRSLDTVSVVRAVKWAYNPNHSPNLDASPNH